MVGPWGFVTLVLTKYFKYQEKYRSVSHFASRIYTCMKGKMKGFKFYFLFLAYSLSTLAEAMVSQYSSSLLELWLSDKCKATRNIRITFLASLAVNQIWPVIWATLRHVLKDKGMSLFLLPAKWRGNGWSSGPYLGSWNYRGHSNKSIGASTLDTSEGPWEPQIVYLCTGKKKASMFLKPLPFWSVTDNKS